VCRRVARPASGAWREERRRVAGHGQPLPQGHVQRELGDGLLARADHVRRRTGQQPAGEHLFAVTRPGRREQLEHRALAKEVQVFGIRMVFVAEARARLARADPSILDARQSTFVVGDGPRRGVARANRAVVPHHEHDERGHGREQHPGCEAGTPDEEPDRDAEREHAEPGVGQPLIRSLQPCMSGAMAGATILVDGSGTRRHGWILSLFGAVALRAPSSHDLSPRARTRGGRGRVLMFDLKQENRRSRPVRALGARS
jgi:hypothetical protein